MQKKFLFFVMLIAISLISGCADDTENPTVEEAEGSAPGQEEYVGTSLPEQHPVRMEFFGFVPTELEINRGDIVTWRNLNQQKVYILISDEGLFEDRQLKYKSIASYTFEKSGVYTFSVEDRPDMVLTVTVR